MDIMDFPQTVDEFMEQYKIVDREEVYTNGAEMVPIFRMKQWFEHEALKKAPTALDHIHNVVRDDAYRRGYEQGQADAPMKRAMGRWILVDDDGKHVCDQCHHYAPSFTKGCSWMSNNGEWLSGFCPNCGADMVESEGEHDESV